MPFTLEVTPRDEAPRPVRVEGSLVVGRAEECDLSLADRRLSRLHARFLEEDGKLYIQDLGGPNGTYVNGRRVKKQELAGGDEVILGKTRFVLLDGAPRTQDLIKPREAITGPSLDSMLGDDFLETLGLGDQTLLSAKADRFDVVVRRTRNFAILLEITRAIQSERDPERMIERALDLLLKVSRSDRGYVALLDDDGVPRVTSVRSSQSNTTNAPTPVISQTIVRHVLQDLSSLLSTDPHGDSRFADSQSIFLSDTQAFMAAPIIVGKRLIGLIEVETSAPSRSYSEVDLDLLTVAGSTLGAALDNAQLLKKREQTIRELEDAHAEILATRDQLVRAEQLAAIGRLSTGIAHEIKNHLSPFMLAEMISAKYPDDADTHESVEMMMEAQEHILDLVNEIRAFSSQEEAEYNLEEIDLAELVERTVRFARCDAKVKKCDTPLQIQGRPAVRVDTRRLRQVLINLLRNAADAAPKPGGQIAVRVLATNAHAIVEVEDNGPGIPEEIQSRIFEPFFTSKGEGGMGLGLDISRTIIQRHGGVLEFHTGPTGTTFRVKLPKRG